MTDLAGKAAVVTGSTSGIGLGVVRALAAAGANVMLNGRSETAEAESLRKDIERLFGVSASYFAADMSKPGDIAAMIGAARASFGHIDILVNNAGVQHVEAIESFPPQAWDMIIAVDLSAAFHTIRAVAPEMKARGWGRIVNIASAHAVVASPFKSAYVAAKHGLAGLTKCVALELAENGVTVNAICPGYVMTPLVRKQIPQTAAARGLTEQQVVRDILLNAQPTRQFVTVEQVGAFARFLCTNSAASITGAILSMDGGWTAQ